MDHAQAGEPKWLQRKMEGRDHPWTPARCGLSDPRPGGKASAFLITGSGGCGHLDRKWGPGLPVS